MPRDLLDRRVRLIADGENGAVKKVSDLRADSFVVLLGEPGMGKSRVLREEAERAGTKAVTVRDVIDGFGNSDGAMFLDALDEYRSDGGARDKVSTLTRHLIDIQSERWWLTCRAEDWRGASDLGLLKRATGGETITVAQLQPLDWDEAITVVTNLGADDPNEFLSRAYRMGADSFTTSPLSLKLLYAAVASTGEWPESRFELFDRAVRQLADEQDEERGAAARDRPPVPAVVQVAGKICLTLLASNAVEVSRRAPVNMSEEQEQREADASLFGLDPSLLTTVLGSALFRGDGRAFEPCHRVVAEFLGAKCLAEQVTANENALPFRRALALMTAPDGKAPTELRGLYAWFASLLAHLGRADLARAMVDRDALTVLQYGDVASLPAEVCKSLLDSLGREDPFFVNFWGSSAGTAGLARDDLEDELRRVIQDPAETVHRRVTVFEALTNGRPVRGLVLELRGMVLDQNLETGDRSRALDAWLNAVPAESDERSALFHDLSQLPASLAREIVRVPLFAALPKDDFNATAVRSVLGDFERAENDRVIGRLWRVRRRLEGGADA